VPNDVRLGVQFVDYILEVVGNLTDGFVSHDLGMPVCFVDCVWVIGPTWRHRRIASLLESSTPAVPAARQQPEPVNEYDNVAIGLIG
jgi:hypothetical protein